MTYFLRNSRKALVQHFRSQLWPASNSKLKLKYAAWLFVCAAVIAPLTFAVKTRSAPASTAPPSVATQATPTPERLIVEQLTLLSTGFQPAEFTRPKGRFLLAVNNRSGVSEMALVLSRETGARLHEVKVQRKELDWNNEFDLNPGTYILTEANHPQWSCRILVTAQ